MYQNSSINDRLRSVHDRSLARSFGNRMSTMSDTGRLSPRSARLATLVGFLFAVVLAAAIIYLPPSQSPTEEIGLMAPNSNTHSVAVMGGSEVVQVKGPVAWVFMVPIHKQPKSHNPPSVFGTRRDGPIV